MHGDEPGHRQAERGYSRLTDIAGELSRRSAWGYDDRTIASRPGEAYREARAASAPVRFGSDLRAAARRTRLHRWLHAPPSSIPTSARRSSPRRDRSKALARFSMKGTFSRAWCSRRSARQWRTLGPHGRPDPRAPRPGSRPRSRRGNGAAPGHEASVLRLDAGRADPLVLHLHRLLIGGDRCGRLPIMGGGSFEHGQSSSLRRGASA